jgi:hypothetical protein
MGYGDMKVKVVFLDRIKKEAKILIDGEEAVLPLVPPSLINFSPNMPEEIRNQLTLLLQKNTMGSKAIS